MDVIDRYGYPLKGQKFFIVAAKYCHWKEIGEFSGFGYTIFTILELVPFIQYKWVTGSNGRDSSMRQ